MGRLSTRTLIVAVLPALALACCGCETAASVDPRQQRLLETVEQFHRLARTDGDAALARYRTDECAARCGATFAVAEKDWTHVLRGSIYGVSFLDHYEALTLFYNPWSDVALIALWQPVGEGFAITDAEAAQGDCIRQRGKPPFSMLRHWRRTEQSPALAVCESAYLTLEAFRGTFKRSSGEQPPAGEWRKRLPALASARSRAAGLVAVTLMVSAALGELAAYRQDAKLAPVRGAVDAALAALRGGRLAEVLRTADETDPATRKELAEDMPGTWAGMKVAAVLDGKEWTYVFLDSADEAGLFVGFLIQKAPGRAALKRIEVMDLWTYYAYKRQGG